MFIIYCGCGFVNIVLFVWSLASHASLQLVHTVSSHATVTRKMIPTHVGGVTGFTTQAPTPCVVRACMEKIMGVFSRGRPQAFAVVSKLGVCRRKSPSGSRDGSLGVKPP